MSNGKQPDNLGREIEREVRQTLDEVAAAVREVGEQLNQDENIRRTVQQVGSAARSGIASLRENVRKGMRDAHKDVRDSVDEASADMRQAWKDAGRDVRDGVNEARDDVRGSVDAMLAGMGIQSKKKNRRKRINYAKKAKSMLSSAAGYGIACGVIGVLAHSSAMNGGDDAGTMLLGFLCFGFMVSALISLFNGLTTRRVAGYQRILGERSYCTVQELAEMTEKPKRYVRTDLRRMIRKGQFEGVFLPPDASRLFSNETAYRLYMAQEAELAAAAAAAPEPEPEPEEKVVPELILPEEPDEAEEPTVLEDCRAFLRDLRDQQRHITDAAVLGETQRIESETQNIIAWLEKHPDGAGQIRRFASYYMPTTLKLLTTYNEVTPQAASSTVAAEIQSDICTILGTVQTAFQSLQNNLLKDTALDISAEISALETVLAQDGLTGSAPFQEGPVLR